MWGEQDKWMLRIIPLLPLVYLYQIKWNIRVLNLRGLHSYVGSCQITRWEGEIKATSSTSNFLKSTEQAEQAFIRKQRTSVKTSHMRTPYDQTSLNFDHFLGSFLIWDRIHRDYWKWNLVIRISLERKNSRIFNNIPQTHPKFSAVEETGRRTW